MSFLETLLCLAMMALVASLSVFSTQAVITRTRLHADQHIIKTALHFARSQATQAVPSTLICKAQACTVTTQAGLKTFPLSGHHQVRTQLFPASAGETFTFTHEGLTAFHNGTIIISPLDKPELEKRVVVSLGGRVSLR